MKQYIPHISALVLMHASPLQAALVAYEPFNYSAPISGTGTASTATGFTGNWNSGQGSLLSTTNLTYSGLPTTANSARGGGATRALSSLASPLTTGTVYASFLLQGGGNSGGVTVGLIFSGPTSSMFVGFGGGVSGSETAFGLATIDTGNTFSFATGFLPAAPITNSTVHFLVMEMNLDTNATSLWIDPTVSNVTNNSLGVPTLTTSTITLGDLTGIGYNSDGINPFIDEVRIGTTLASVAAVPEPSSAVLLGLGSLALFRRRRASK